MLQIRVDVRVSPSVVSKRASWVQLLQNQRQCYTLSSRVKPICAAHSDATSRCKRCYPLVIYRQSLVCTVAVTSAVKARVKGFKRDMNCFAQDRRRDLAGGSLLITTIRPRKCNAHKADVVVRSAVSGLANLTGVAQAGIGN